MELKVDASAEDAVAQIREKKYGVLFKDTLVGDALAAVSPLAVGIAWDSKTKKHTCVIEEL